MKPRNLAPWLTRLASAIQPPHLRAALFVALLLLGVCLFSLWGYGALSVFGYQPKHPATLSGQTRTQCVGRYLIDTPVELGNFQVGNAWFQYGKDRRAQAVQVTVFPDAYLPERYAADVQGAIESMERGRNEALGIPLLLARQAWDTPHGKASLLRHLQNEIDAFAPVISTVLVLLDQRLVKLEGRSYESGDSLSQPGPSGHRVIDPAPMEAQLRRIAQHLRTTGNADPAPDGFCMDGVLMDPKTMGYDVETATFSLQLNEDSWARTEFSISMEGHLQPREQPLTERIAHARATERWQYFVQGAGPQVVALRQGPRSVDAMPGLEYAEGRHAAPAVWFVLGWESQSAPAQQSLQRPAISMGLWLGDREEASPLDRQQALRLWDSLLQSLRLAPANGG